MDTTIKTQGLRLARGGGPMPPHHPRSAGSSQRNCDVPIPQELGLPSLEGRRLGRIRKRSPKWWWLKDKEGESPQQYNKGSSEDQSEDLR